MTTRPTDIEKINQPTQSQFPIISKTLFNKEKLLQEIIDFSKKLSSLEEKIIGTYGTVK